MRIEFGLFPQYRRGSHYYTDGGYRVRVPRRFHSGLIPEDYKFAVTEGRHADTEWLYPNELAALLPWVKVQELSQ